MKVIIYVVLAIKLTDNIWHRHMIQQSNIMAQKECLGRNAFFLLFHFCIEKYSYATSGAGTACHSGAPESTPELRVPSLVF
jgi:hypothetical protein